MSRSTDEIITSAYKKAKKNERANPLFSFFEEKDNFDEIPQDVFENLLSSFDKKILMKSIKNSW